MSRASMLRKLTEFSKSLRVLYVEDNQEAREQTLKMLRNLCLEVEVAKDGYEGLNKFSTNPDIDLIVTDINMPYMSGIEMCEEIRKIDQDIPLIILSAHNDAEYFIDTIRLGVDGYILKPVDTNQLLSTLFKSIEKLKLREENDRHAYQLEQLNQLLEHQVDERILEIIELNKEIEETQKEVILTMGAIGEHRLQETGNHVKRVAEYSKLFALYCGMKKEEAEILKAASPLHDIGKVAIPDAILNKKGKLTDDEYEVMKEHAEIGYSMLKRSKKAMLKTASIVAYQHHERWDGKGYPRGLKGEDIHIYGRITALADVFDALGSHRCYKEAWSDEKIFSFFKEERGKHFDPKIVDIFFANLDEFLDIRERFKDDSLFVE